MAYGSYSSSRYSRASIRKRRRRRMILLSVLGALVVAGGGGTALAIFGVPSFGSTGGRTGTLTSSRFEGLGTVTIPDGPQEEMWWTATQSDTVTDVPGSVFADNGQYVRTRIPADLLFAADSTTLSAEALASIKKIAARLRDTEAKIYVVCHASRDGVVAQRKTLSVKRANALAGELESLLNRPKGSIERIGRGDRDPLPNVDPNSATGKTLNRRCEIYVQN